MGLVIYRVFLMSLVLHFFLINNLRTKDLGQDAYVTCHLDGQLGNQCYQIATTLAYAWDHNVRPIIPELERNNLNIPINRQRIFFRLDSSALPRPVKYFFKYLMLFEKKEIPPKPDLHLNGYFQTWKYFDHHRKKIIDIFAPSPHELSRIQLKYAELLNHPCTVGVHVRTFNKKWSKELPFVGLAYYEKALSCFPPEALFVVFSDRINWCKHHFKKFNRPMIFIEGNDHIEDFFLMSMLRHNIIGNSSFSWWAAYLNKNANKIVIAPSHFVCSTSQFLVSAAHANLPEWITIPSNPDHSIDHYPEDMYSYDAASQSIDTQAERLLKF